MPRVANQTADRALRRYLDRGAPEALAALFDAAAEPLWRIALHLLGDANRAEDALQETFLAVIEARARPAVVPAADALAWLTGVLHNRVRRQRRDVARLPDRERVEDSLARLEADDPLTRAERRELVAAVERELHQLPETYRPVLRLALQHGLAPHEIAATLERAPVTVRVQLSRGLELLRGRLGSGLAGSLLAACASLGVATAQGLPAIRSAIVEAAHGALPVGVGAAAALTTTATTLLMKKLTLSIVAVAALLTTGWMLWDDAVLPTEPAGTEAGASIAPSTAALAAEAEEEQRIPAGSVTVARTEIESNAASSPGRAYGSVRVKVTWQDDGTPAPGVGVQVYCWGVANPFLHQVQGVTDAAGEVVLERVLLGKLDVRTDHQATEVTITEPGQEATAELAVARHATLVGRVVDHQGQPVAGATLLQSNYFNHSSCFPVAKADAEGRFRIPFGRECYLGARAPGHVPSHYFLISLEAGQTERVTIPLRGPAGRLVGRVVDADGEPVHGARIQHGESGVYVRASKAERLVGDRVGSPRATTAPHPWLVTGADGRFAIDDLPAGPVKVRARALDHAEAEAQVEVVAGADAEVEILLPTHAVVTGRVVDADGSPVKVRITAGDARYGDFGFCTTRTGADGTFVLDSLTPGRVALKISSKEAGRASTTLELAAGETGEWNPVLERIPTLTGRVVDPLGVPIEGMRVQARNLDMSKPNWDRDETDSAGRFTITGLRDEPHRVRVFSPKWDGFACRDAGEARPGGEPLEIVIRQEELPSAWIRGSVRAPDNVGLVGAKLTLWHGNRGHFQTFDPETGAFEIGPLPPRDVRLVMNAGRLGDVEIGAWRLEPYQRVDVGEVLLAEPGRVQVELGYESGQHAAVQLAYLDGAYRSGGELLDGRMLLEPIPPGDYVVYSAGSVYSRCVRISVRSGQTTRVRLTRDDRPERVLEIHRGRSGRAMFSGRVLDADGVLNGHGWASTEERIAEMRIRPPADGRAFTVVLQDQSMTELVRKTFAAGDELVITLP